MSYSGTVRCSICYGRGHNKSGCPTVLERYKTYQKLVAEYKKKNPDVNIEDGLDWNQRMDAGISYKHLQAASIIETKQRKNKGRTCTYCSEQGHNRRTCSPLKSHVDQLIAGSTIYNTKVAKVFELAGIHVGGLVQHKVEEYDSCKGEWVKEDKIGVISNIDLKSYNVVFWLFNTQQSHNSIIIRTTDGKQYNLRPELGDKIKRELCVGYTWGSTGYTVLSSKDTPVPPHVIDEKEERKRIKEALKDTTSRSVSARLERLNDMLKEGDK